MSKAIIDTAKESILLQANSVAALAQQLQPSFVTVVELLFSTRGRVIVSGIGKSAIVAQKIVATFNSTGTPSMYMHAADAIHGDLGMVQPGDVVIIISKSGESPEIKALVPLIKSFGNTLIGMVGNVNSFLGVEADYVLDTTVEREACINNLAPTSSTTAQMVMGDALAVCLEQLRGFNSTAFAKYHPGGNLGKRLYLQVQDISKQNAQPQVAPTAALQEVIFSLSKGRLGITVVVENQQILGIITDGDIRRMLETHANPFTLTAAAIMNPQPKTVQPTQLAVEALEQMKSFDISQLVVVQQGKYQGIVHMHDLMKEGII